MTSASGVPGDSKPIVDADLERHFETIRRAFGPESDEASRQTAMGACIALHARVQAELERDVFDVLLERLLPLAPAEPARPFSVPIIPFTK